MAYVDQNLVKKLGFPTYLNRHGQPESRQPFRHMALSWFGLRYLLHNAATTIVTIRPRVSGPKLSLVLCFIRTVSYVMAYSSCARRSRRLVGPKRSRLVVSVSAQRTSGSKISVRPDFRLSSSAYCVLNDIPAKRRYIRIHRTAIYSCEARNIVTERHLLAH